eukprot:tig00000903_g5516.t1
MEKGWIAGKGKLDLSGDGRTTWPTEEIKRAGPANIRVLNLGRNKLTSIPGAELAKLTNLEELDLCFNQLTAIPPEIGRLAALRKLRLGNNQELDMAFNQLTTLAPEIGQLANLQKLNLCGNGLETLPPELGRLANLTELEVGGNQLATLPAEIGQLAALRQLDVSFNRLTALPPAIGQLASLRSLVVEENPLTTMPERARKSGAAALVYLRSLAVQRSQLAELEKERAEHVYRLVKMKMEADTLKWGMKDKAELQKTLEATRQKDKRLGLSERRQAELELLLVLYEGKAAPNDQQWGEAELEAAAERLKAAAKRVEELRIEARAAALVEERVKRRRLEGPSTYECPICCEEQDPKERRLLTNCGHVICATCAQKTLATKDGAKVCPTCRKPVTGVSPIFDR